MARWFRSHAAKLTNHKVQMLSDALYRAWDSLLCLACEYDGVLPPLPVCAFYLRKSEEEARELLNGLMEADLFVLSERGYAPHDWDKWQYKSDAVSTERVKRFRQQRAVVSPDPSENQSTESDSVANATAADAAPTAKALFDDGVKLLTATGTSERHARSIIGKWRKEAGDEAVFAGLKAARSENVTEPIAWMTQRFASAARPRETPRETWDQRRIREAREAVRQ